MSHRVKSRIEV